MFLLDDAIRRAMVGKSTTSDDARTIKGNNPGRILTDEGTRCQLDRNSRIPRQTSLLPLCPAGGKVHPVPHRAFVVNAKVISHTRALATKLEKEKRREYGLLLAVDRGCYVMVMTTSSQCFQVPKSCSLNNREFARASRERRFDGRSDANIVDNVIACMA